MRRPKTADPNRSDHFSGLQPEELLRRRDEIDARIRELHYDDEGEARDLVADEQAELDQLVLERQECQRRLDWHASIRDHVTRHPGSVLHPFAIAANGRRGEWGGVAPDDALRMQGDQARDRALAVLDAAARDLPARDVDRVESMIRSRLSGENRNLDGDYVARRTLITESPAYRSAFRQLMTQSHPLLTNDEILAVRALGELEERAGPMSENVTTQGGFGVPVFIDPTVMLSGQVEAAPLLDLCRVEPVTTNVWKGVSSAGVSWSFDTEGSAVSDDSPALAQPSVLVHMARGFIPYTIEVEEDYPSFATQMAEVLAAGYVDLIAQKLITGSGSGEPKGILTALDATAASEVLLTTAGSFGAVDVFKIWNGVPERFRSRAAWLMSVSVESQIRSFSTANQPSAYFTVDLTAEGITRLNGKRTAVTDYMPSWTGTSGHANVVICGDLRRAYLVAQRSGMSVERVQTLVDTTTGRPTGMRGAFAWARTGADLILPTAARLLNST